MCTSCGVDKDPCMPITCVYSAPTAQGEPMLAPMLHNPLYHGQTIELNKTEGTAWVSAGIKTMDLLNYLVRYLSRPAAACRRACIAQHGFGQCKGLN